MKSSLNVKLQGHTPAFRDAEVELTNRTTGEKIVRKPFLDGTLLVRDIDSGPWEVQVRHPNLNLPIDVRDIRVFDQPSPTLVPIPVPPVLFRDTPIRDIPDADLSPVQQTATSVRDRVNPLAGKAAGEVIRSADWNALTGAVAELSGAVLELAKLVSPHGHDHPEIADKIDEVQTNLRRFAEAFGRSLVELRREIETGSLRRQADRVLGVAGASSEVRDRLLGRIGDLESALQSDTTTFTQKLASTGSLILSEIQALAADQPELGEDESVKRLTASARQYFDAGTQTRPESELQTYERTTSTSGAKLVDVLRPGG